MVNLKRMADLIEKRLDNTITEAENLELENWGDESPANRSFLQKYLQPGTIDDNLKAYLQMDEERIFRKFVARYVHKKPRPRRIWKAVAAAVTGIIIIVAAGIIFFRSEKEDLLLQFPDRPAAIKKLLSIMDSPTVKPVLLIGELEPKYLSSDKPEETLEHLGYYVFRKTDSLHLAIEIKEMPSYDYNKNDSVNSIFSIPPGKDSWQVSLPDSTKVVLKPGSALSVILYPYASPVAQRSVVLQGSAIFKVEPRSGVPFRVITNRWSLSVLGTQFTVTDYKKEKSSETRLNSGEISISNGYTTTTLRKPKISKTSDGSKEISIKDDPNPPSAIPWKDDFWDFSRDRLRVAMQRVKDWYDIPKISYRGKLDTISPYRSGEIQKNLPMDQFFNAVKTKDVKLSISEDGTTLIVQGR
ncbi:MAG TPA: FecR family protein [Puia sp.]